jgi:DNA polymerase-3 subunit gamma/tau
MSSWNRTYRPTKVSDLHLDFVRTQIQRMMDSGKIPQALLFAGPKGTGKTSTSRIIGAVVNDPKNATIVESNYFTDKIIKKQLSEPDSNSEFNKKIFAGTSFVVQEMDAASNRGIDDIRQLKTRAYLPPQEGKMSVFILDEAHMLTTEAFNALLKLLEEPPEHVIFILATTELHKIPGTIISRCQLVDFKKATNQEIKNRLKSILISEKIEFEEKALDLIAQNADGSFRDAVKLLELSAQSGKITQSEVSVFSSANVSTEVETLLKNLLNKDETSVVELFESLREKSVDQNYFHKSVLESLHKSLLQNLKVLPGESVINKTVAQFLLQELSDSSLSSASPISHLKLELKILALIDRSKSKSGASAKKTNPTINKAQTNVTQASNHTDLNYEQNYDQILESDYSFKDETTIAPEKQISSYEKEFNAQVNREDKIADTVTTTMNISQYNGDANLLKEQWHDFIDELASDNSTLASLLRSAKLVSHQDSSATVGVYYKFHQEQLSQKKSMTAIQDCMQDLFSGYIDIDFIVLKPPVKAELVDPQNEDQLVDSAIKALL